MKAIRVTRRRVGLVLSLAAVAIIAIGAAAAGSVSAAPGPAPAPTTNEAPAVVAKQTGPQVGAEAALAATTSKSGSTISRDVIVTQDAAVVYTQTAWTTIATTYVYAPLGAFLISDFTAESACYGGGGSGYCSVRLTVDGVEAGPAVGTDFAFDSTDGGTETGSSWESHSVKRTYTAPTSATHTIQVQIALVGATSFRLDDWAWETRTVQL